MKPFFKKAAAYLIGKLFLDEEEQITYQITGIVAPERKSVPYFKYYYVHSYLQGLSQDDKHEYQPVSELLYKPRGQPQYLLRPPTKNRQYKFLISISAGVHVEKESIDARVKIKFINSILHYICVASTITTST